MDRIKRKSAGTYLVEHQAVDDDGENLTPTAPFTATVVDGAGAVVAAAVPVSCVDGLFSHQFANDVFELLDTYTITWSGQLGGVATEWDSSVELVGGYLFEIAQLRKHNRSFEDVDKYPGWWMRAVRTQVEMTMEGERAAAVAFVPRGRRITISGSGTDTLILPDFNLRSVLSVWVDGAKLPDTELAKLICDDTVLVSSGWVWPKGRRNIEIHYEHGQAMPPGPVSRAAVVLAQDYAAGAGVPSRATAQTIGEQMFRITVAGRDGITGIGDVDAVIDQFGRKRYSVA